VALGRGRDGKTVRARAVSSHGLSETAKAELDTAMRTLLPSAPLTWMIGLGADGVAAELAGSVARSSR
jgi:hypothetical protein